MVLTLNNIGKISDATVELNGITVIAGENNTGKSTIGKVLFCLFNSLYRIDEQIYNERKRNIKNVFNRIHVISSVGIELNRMPDSTEIVAQLLENGRDNHEITPDEISAAIRHYFERHFEKVSKPELRRSTEVIADILSLSDDVIFKEILSLALAAEFNGQINNIYLPDESGNISLKIQKKTINVSVIENEAKIVDTVPAVPGKISLNTEVTYIDDPFVLDDADVEFSSFFDTALGHREHLKSKLFAPKTKSVIGKIIVTQKLEKILGKMQSVCNGEMNKSAFNKYVYTKKGSDKGLDIRNISTGLKSFVILKTLLINGTLEDNGTLILDEPEIHLHPEWQKLFAELIVLIQKEFDMHILLNTHSPYFLYAIEVYSAKYKIADKCKYYLAEEIKGKSKISDVTTDIDRIYQKLSRSLQDLENERYSDSDDSFEEKTNW